MFFEDFACDRVDIGEAVLRVRHGGSGPPVVLLHGHPRTHATWHRVAGRLIESHTVVCPDLRGYGKSGKPPTTPDHAPYSKRAMAGDIVTMMRNLGHDRFAVVGHDRGTYVALRLALDHPEVASHLVAMDGVPIGAALDRCDARFAQRGFTGSSSPSQRRAPSTSSARTPTGGTAVPARRRRWVPRRTRTT